MGVNENSIVLNNGMEIPIPGFGTDQVPDGETVINAVTWAIESGYRHIDNADCYNNDAGGGFAIKICIDKGIVKREEFFFVIKVPDWKQGYDSTIKCCKESLKLTGLDYFDLYLVHSPRRAYDNWKQSVLDTYRAIETLYKEGLVKTIGVSNFEIRHLEFILEEAEIKPVVNQIEFHPQHQQKHVVEFCKKHVIQVVGWGTLNQGRIFKNDVFKQLAEKYQKDIGQIATRYSYQKGVVPLVRSTKKERIESNGKIFDFAISSEDMLLLDSLDGGEFSNWHHDGIKPMKMVPADSQEYKPVKYTRKYKLFGFIPFLVEKKYRWNKTKWFLFGIIPLVKIIKKDVQEF